MSFKVWGMKPFRGAGFRESRPLERIKEFSWRLGFQASGAVSADFLKEEEERLDRWLAGGMHGTMSWMERNRGKRLDPRQLMEGAKTVIVVLQNYFTRQHQEDPSAPVVSKYAYGRDYHPVMKAKLKELLRFIQQEITPCQGRVFVDSAPVLERAWARRARLGWIGKNGMLISPEYGSFLFIGILLIDAEICPGDSSEASQGATIHPGREVRAVELLTESEHRELQSGADSDEQQHPLQADRVFQGKPDSVTELQGQPISSCGADQHHLKQPGDSEGGTMFSRDIPDRCGTCTRCMDACPTKAIIAPRMVDARRCISYLTIEHQGKIDPQFRGKMENRVFGCDICQDVCPWNRKAPQHDEPRFRPSTSLLQLTKEDWYALDEIRFNEIFGDSALSRTGFDGIRKNLSSLISFP